MGQYFMYVNIDKKEIVDPTLCGDNGLKEMEHSYLGNFCVETVVNLLAKGWKGDRVIHLGDYADELENDPRFKPVLQMLVKEFDLKKHSDGEYHYCDIEEACVTRPALSPQQLQKLDITKVIRYILVDDDKYIDRYDMKYGEYRDPDDTNISLDKLGLYVDANNKLWAIKNDGMSLAIAVGEGSGGSYYFEEGSIQQKLHGSLAGHRLAATNDEKDLNGRTKIDLSEFGAYSVDELCTAVDKDHLEKLLVNELNLFTEAEEMQIDSAIRTKKNK